MAKKAESQKPVRKRRSHQRFSQVLLKTVDPLIEHLQQISGQSVLQIGCGTGVITAYLNSICTRVVGVEIDTRFSEYLTPFNVRFEDFLLADVPSIFEAVVSNLPFRNYLAFIFRTLRTHPEISKYYLIVQKQCALEMSKGKRRVGRIIRHHFKVQLLTTLPSQCYSPQPKVDTMLVKLTKLRDYDQRIDTLKRIKPNKRLEYFGKSFCALNDAEFMHLLDRDSNG